MTLLLVSHQAVKREVMAFTVTRWRAICESWRIATQAILHDLRVVPKEGCFVLGLEGGLVDGGVGLFKLRIMLMLMLDG